MAVSLATRGLQRRARPVRLAAPLPRSLPRSPHVPLRPVPAPGRAGRPVVRRRRRRAAPPATDGPGALSHFDLARKDCVGTARNTTSKVWFTVANGVLSDVYFPTNDNTNVETLQYLVTDGSSFTDLQTRDTTYTVQATDDRALTCRVTTTAKSGRYKIVTDYTTDPSRPTVLIRSKFVALKGRLSDYRLYVRHDPTLNGNGGGGTGNGGADDGAPGQRRRPHAARRLGHRHEDQRGQPRLRDPRVLGARRQPRLRPGDQRLRGQPPATASCSSTPSHALTDLHDSAVNGNVVQVGRVAARPSRRASRSRSATATRQAGAISASQRSLKHGFDDARRDYERGWNAYDDKLVKPRRPHGVSSQHWNDILDEYYLSANYVKAAEDKTFPGAVAASLTSPWGQAISAGDPNNTYFGSYREVFARDLYEAWTAVFLAGDRRTATRHDALPLRAPAAARRLDAAQQPAQRQARARQLQHPARRVRLPADHGAGRRAHRQRLLQGPHRAGRQLRGQPRARRSAPSAGRSRAASRPRPSRPRSRGSSRRRSSPTSNGDHASARVWRGVGRRVPAQPQEVDADHQRAAQHASPYFIRLSKTGDPNAAIIYNVGNGGPTLDQRAIIDAGFLEYARLGLLKPDRRRHPRARCPWSTRRSSAAPPAATASCATTATATATASTDGHPWAPSQQGHRPPVAGARRRARPVRDRPRLGERRHRAAWTRCAT